MGLRPSQIADSIFFSQTNLRGLSTRGTVDTQFERISQSHEISEAQERALARTRTDTGEDTVPFKTITINDAIGKIRKHDFVLPAIQREFVWGTDRICQLFDSLMRGYPIGSFLFWQVEPETIGTLTFYDFMRTYHRKNHPHCDVLEVDRAKPITAILDGQQRLSSLNIGLRGSHADKLPRLRAENPSAYPEKFLCLDLLSEIDDSELDLAYRFAFKTRPEISQTTEQHWFEISKVLDFKDTMGAVHYITSSGLPAESMNHLVRLFDIVHKDLTINYYEEPEQDLEKVLKIFVRVNSGAVPLSFSDLLLSIATSQWKERDARAVIHDLVDDLNDTGQGFSFDKNTILKTGLVLLGKRDIRFNVSNFDRDTMQAMEAQWDGIESALRLGVTTLAHFGFHSATLSASNILIPVVFYLHVRGLDDSYLSSKEHADDREQLRLWIIRSLIQSGVWGSGLDTLISGLRTVLETESHNGFPRLALEREMARQGKQLAFGPEQLEDLLDTKYGAKSFPVLSLLYPGVNTRNGVHMDHVYPKSLFTPAKLRKAGLSKEDAEIGAKLVDRLPNLQLLDGAENINKRAMLPSQWMSISFANDQARQRYADANDLHNIGADERDFLNFFENRRTELRERLRNLLGVEEYDHENIFTSRDLLKDSNSKRGDIASHIQSAFEDKRLGDFLTIQEIRNHRSTGYGVDNPTNPSAGAISARLFPTSGSCTVTGVRPAKNETGVRGARKSAD